MKGKAQRETVKVTVELTLTKRQLDVLASLTGYGAVSREEVCTDIIMRTLRHHDQLRTRSALIPSAIPPDPAPVEGDGPDA